MLYNLGRDLLGRMADAAGAWPVHFVLVLVVQDIKTPRTVNAGRALHGHLSSVQAVAVDGARISGDNHVKGDLVQNNTSSTDWAKQRTRAHLLNRLWFILRFPLMRFYCPIKLELFLWRGSCVAVNVPCRYLAARFTMLLFFQFFVGGQINYAENNWGTLLASTPNSVRWWWISVQGWN